MFLSQMLQQMEPCVTELYTATGIQKDANNNLDLTAPMDEEQLDKLCTYVALFVTSNTIIATFSNRLRMIFLL